MGKVNSQNIEDAALAWKLVEKLDDQRSHPRIELGVPVAFRNANGQHCVAKLVNISLDGVQIRSNVATAQILHPGGGKIGEGNAPIVQISIALPLADGSAVLSACTKLSYLTTVEEEPRCVLGLKFLDLRPTAKMILEQFFVEKLKGYFDIEDYEEPQRAIA
ncbi:MAG: hypothetical protein ACI9BW_000384 [Gammaproteobacteria bacterium]